MTRAHDVSTCTCGKCRQPMRLINSLPKLGALPELLVFYCQTCDEVEGRDGSANTPSDLG